MSEAQDSVEISVEEVHQADNYDHGKDAISDADDQPKMQKYLAKKQEQRDNQSIVEWLDEEFAVIPLVGKVQSLTGIPATLQALILLGVLVWKALSGELASEIAVLVGTFYPFFKSIAALQTDTDFEDDKTWLTYWMCYGCFTVADMHIGWILEIIPFYYTMKLLLLVWLQLPLGPLMGAKIVYRVFLKPIFRCIGPAIKAFQERHSDQVYQLNSEMNKNLNMLKKQAMETGTETFMEMAMERMQEEKSTAEE